MQDDDGWVDESYYIPPVPPELKPPKEKKKKSAKAPKSPRTLKEKRRRRLDDIAADPSNSFSDRQDARHLAESAEVNPREFNRRFAELIARVQQKEKENMTIYSQVSAQMGLNNDSQGDDAFLHALLMFADANPPGGGNTHANPYTEVAHRFRNLNPHALAAIKSMLSDGEIKFAAGRP